MRKTNRLNTALTLLTLVLLCVAADTAAAQEPTSIAKDTILVNLSTYDAYRKNEDVWSWAPDLRFRINGPVGDDALVYVEYNIPGSPTLRFDCPVRNDGRGYRMEVNCSSYGIKEKGPTYAGLVPFAIKMQSELRGTSEVTLFAGTMKVVKLLPPPNEPRGHFVYYVDHDWTLPIAYVFYEPGSDGGWKRPTLSIAFWVRSQAGDSGDFYPYIFNKGQEVGVAPYGRFSCRDEVKTGTEWNALKSSENVNWMRVECNLYTVAGWDTRGPRAIPIFSCSTDTPASTR